MKPLRIIFMGTPEFAVASLEKLLHSNHKVVAVITAPDKPAGRGMLVNESDVKKFALKNNLKILQPIKLKDPEFLATLKSLEADLQVVVAFRMLPEVVWNMPALGTINLHASLLPQYRGAAPINWAIINGEKETGITTFKLQHEIDTGNILFQQKIAIANNDTAGTLHDNLMIAGADLVLKTVNNIAEGYIAGIKQAETHTSVLKTAPKIFTETCEINWQLPSNDVYNLVRGLSPYPTAFTFLKNKKLKIYSAEKEIVDEPVTPGQVFSDNKTYLKFSTADGYLLLKEIQLEGKKKMKIEDFLNGWRMPVNS
jgi:methionyl-tRNA formyltransferase